MDTNNLLQWAQTEGAQPYLKMAGVDPMSLGMTQQSSGGYGAGMGFAPYQNQLMQWIEANPQNPSLQQSLIGEYFNTGNPYQALDYQNQQMEYQNQQRADDLNLALALMDLGKEDMANQILSQYGIGGGGSGYGAALDPQQLQLNAFRSSFEPRLEGETDPNNVALYSLLSQASPEIMNEYNRKPTWWERFSSGSQFGRAALDALLPGLGTIIAPANKEKMAEERIKSAYGL